MALVYVMDKNNTNKFNEHNINCWLKWLRDKCDIRNLGGLGIKSINWLEILRMLIWWHQINVWLDNDISMWIMSF